MRKPSFDLEIPESYRGRILSLLDDRQNTSLVLEVPYSACYLDVFPLEDEEEFHHPDMTLSHKILYYNKNRRLIGYTLLDNAPVSEVVISRLERILKKTA